MESQHSVGWPTCNDFPRFAIISEISRPEVQSRWRRSPKSCLFGKMSPYGQIFTMFSERIHGDIDPRLVCNFVKFGWPEIGKVVRYLLDKKNFGWLSRSHFCTDRPRNLSGPAPDNILGLPQISSESGPLFNAAKFGWRPLLECHAVTLPRRERGWNLQGCSKLANRSQPLVGRWGHVEEVSVFNRFFSDCRYIPQLQRYSPTKLCDGAKMAICCVLHFQRAACSTFQTCILNSH